MNHFNKPAPGLAVSGHPDRGRRLLLLGAALGAVAPAPGLAQAPNPAPKQPPTRSVLVLGDSLSAEYGLKRGSGWVEMLRQRLERQKPGAAVVNASISGDTTSGGRSRLPALLKAHQPGIVVIELGGNDALRGLPLSMTEDNLRAMVRASQDAGARVLLLGMQMPPNYGAQYGKNFAQLYTRIGRETRSAVVPFFLKGVADIADATRLFQADRIHPNEEAQAIMLDNVWPEMKKLLK